MRHLLIDGWDTYKQYSRLLNVLLLVLCVAALTTNIMLRRSRASRRSRRILMWVYLIMLNLVYGYSITIREHRMFNGAVGLNTVLLFGLLVAIIWHPDGDDRKPPNDGALGTKFVLWLDNNVRAFKARRGRNTNE